MLLDTLKGNELNNQLYEAMAQQYQECEDDLATFVDCAWQLLEPGKALVWSWADTLICEYLQAVGEGQIKRLIINVPPRSGKSTKATVCFPAWTWTKKPPARFLFTSFSQSLSSKHSVDRRSLIESPWYQMGWAHRVQLAADQNVKTEFQNTERGHMIATSMLGTATGKGGDFVIADDPHDPKNAESDLQRESAIQAFDRTFTSRLDNKKEGRMVVIMQRLHEKDLTGHLLEQGGWEHLCLPAESPTRKTFVFPISKREKTREPGELLCPKREGKTELDQMRIAMGAYAYAGQYEQEPAPPGGGMFDRAWWKYYKQMPERIDDWVIAMDATFKDSANSDFVTIGVWARKGGDKFLVHQVRDRMDFPTSVQALRSVCYSYKHVGPKLVEDKANGPAIIATLKREIPGIIAQPAEGSKESRAAAITADAQAGNIWLPDPSIAPWVGAYVEEFAKFPRGVHDDQVDQTVYSILWLNKRMRLMNPVIPVGVVQTSTFRR